MHPSLKEILPVLEKRLESQIVEKFKIGITSQSKEDRFCVYKEEYNAMSIIAESEDVGAVEQAEIDLIKWAMENDKISSKCANISCGGNGPIDDSHKVYIVAKIDAEIDDYYEKLLPDYKKTDIKEVLIIKPVKL